jgi:hypothetical protein
LKVTRKCNLSKKDEAHWQEEQVDAGLTAPEYQFHGLKHPAKLQLLRQDVTEKEETIDGEYNVDILRYKYMCAILITSPTVYCRLII